MNKLGSITPSNNSKPAKNQTGVNPFARALAESEKRTYSKQNSSKPDHNLWSEALAKTGGEFPQEFNQQNLSPEQTEIWQQKLKEEQQRERLRQKLHDQVNPVDKREIFNAQEEKTKKDLEEVREELKKLSQEIKKFHQEVDIQLTQNVVKQGQDGIGLKSYFQKLREFIILLTKQVKSARTWMQQQNKVSHKRKIRGGVLLTGRGPQESKAVFDMMHHERSNAYSGA